MYIHIYNFENAIQYYLIKAEPQHGLIHIIRCYSDIGRVS